MTRKWIEVNDFSGDQYSVNKNIRSKTPMLRSVLCDYSDAYIVVKGTVTVEVNGLNNRASKKLAFKNNVLFRSCISKINNKFIDNVEDLDIVMSIYNLSDLWQLFYDIRKFEVIGDINEIVANYGLNNNRLKTTKTAVLLKYLSNF